MKKEFNLSEKRESKGLRFWYRQQDVKEFIKRIKENSVEIHNCDENCKGYKACQISESLVIRKDVLDKLAGDGLIELEGGNKDDRNKTSK